MVFAPQGRVVRDPPATTAYVQVIEFKRILSLSRQLHYHCDNR